MAFDSIFPFLPSSANSPPQLFPYDVIINTAFPGVEFIGTEPNALYQEIREVNGCLWIVTNAQYNQNLLQWDQEALQNTTLPAYALELCDGAMTRYYSPATLIPDTPITWIPLWTVTDIGLMDSTPLEITGVTDPMNQLQVTWDPGVGIAPTAREVDITDIASSPNSLLDNLVVNGVQVWTVNKEGVLIHGTIPASAIPGIFNNATFTGTTTFTGPVDAPGEEITADSFDFDFGGSAVNAPTITTGPILIPPLVSDVTIPIRYSNFFPEGTTVLVSGPGSSFAGPVISGTPTSITVDNFQIITGSVGDTIFAGATVSYTTSYALTSLDNSITINNVGTPAAPIANLEVNTAALPVMPLSSPDGSITVTPVGNGYDIETNPAAASARYPVGGSIVAYGGSGTSLSIPPVGASWNVMSFQAISTSNAGTGIVVATGTGGTAGGAFSGGTDPVPNNQPQNISQLNGFVNAGDHITVTISATGGALITTTNMQIIATRVT
jgi:hypothetical protein